VPAVEGAATLKVVEVPLETDFWDTIVPAWSNTAARHQPVRVPALTVMVMLSPGAKEVLLIVPLTLSPPCWWQPLHVVGVVPWQPAQMEP
jgi:hypothetical protein